MILMKGDVYLLDEDGHGLSYKKGESGITTKNESQVS